MAQDYQLTSPVDPVKLFFFDGETEVTEEEFLAKHPAPVTARWLAHLRATIVPRRCSCHGEVSTVNVVDVCDDYVEIEMNWCEEEMARERAEFIGNKDKWREPKS